MSKANNKFKKLGFREVKGVYDDCYIVYRNRRNTYEVVFDLEDEDFSVKCALGTPAIPMRLLEAILLKCKELGFINKEWFKERYNEME